MHRIPVSIPEFKLSDPEATTLAGSYESLADPEPTQVEVTGARELKLESGFQALRFSTALLPLGENRFMAVDDLLAGAIIRFTEGAKERRVELETIAGAVQIAVFRK